MNKVDNKNIELVKTDTRMFSRQVSDLESLTNPKIVRTKNKNHSLVNVDYKNAKPVKTDTHLFSVQVTDLGNLNGKAKKQSDFELKISDVRCDHDHECKEEDQEYVRSQPVSAVLFLATVTMCLQAFLFGVAIGMPNNSQAAMTWDGISPSDWTGQSPVFHPPLTKHLWNWVVSLLAIGAMFGGFFGGPLVKKIGPKKLSLLTDLIFMISGIVMALSGTANSIAMLIIGRIILGIAAGFCCNSVPIYVNDSSPIRLRGSLGTLFQLHVTVGIFFAALIGMQDLCGNSTYWWILYGLPLPVGTLHLAIMFFLPESPKWLTERKRTAEAESALLIFRSKSYNTDAEIAKYIEENNSLNRLDLREQYKILFSKKFAKQISIGLLLMAFQQLSGINAVMFYSNSIFLQAGVRNAEVAAIIVAAFNTVATIPAIPIIDRMGRRFLLILGFAGQGTFNILFVVSFIYHWEWPSVIFILGSVGCFAFGPGPIPWMITSEILPLNIAPAGVSICVLVNWLFTFLIGQLYPYMNDGIKQYSFLPFACCCFTASLGAFLFLPETKGKTPKEIKDVFSHYKRVIRFPCERKRNKTGE